MTQGNDPSRAVRFGENLPMAEGSSNAFQSESAQIPNQAGIDSSHSLAKPVFGKAPPGAQSMTLQSDISGVYLGGSAARDGESAQIDSAKIAQHQQYLRERSQNVDGINLDSSFDGSLRKPHTQVQQANQGQNGLTSSALTPVKIPSQVASVSEQASPTFEKSTASAMRRKAQAAVPQEDLLKDHRT